MGAGRTVVFGKSLFGTNWVESIVNSVWTGFVAVSKFPARVLYMQAYSSNDKIDEDSRKASFSMAIFRGNGKHYA